MLKRFERGPVRPAQAGVRAASAPFAGAAREASFRAAPSGAAGRHGVQPREASLSDYTAESIRVLRGLEGVRRRPAMYVQGGTGVDGYHQLLTEIIDNAVDEALAGYAETIEVALMPDGSARVRDDGRGIPVEVMKKENRPAIEVIFTELHAGGKFDSDAYKVSGGLHGVGSSVVNALSDYLEAEVVKDGKVWRIRFDGAT